MCRLLKVMTARRGDAGGRASSTRGPMAVPGRQRDERRLELASRVTS